MDSLVGRLDQVHKAVSDDQDSWQANQKQNTPKARAAAPKLKLALDRDSDEYFNLLSQFKDATQRLHDLMLDVACPQ